MLNSHFIRPGNRTICGELWRFVSNAKQPGPKGRRIVLGYWNTGKPGRPIGLYGGQVFVNPNLVTCLKCREYIYIRGLGGLKHGKGS